MSSDIHPADSDTPVSVKPIEPRHAMYLVIFAAIVGVIAWQIFISLKWPEQLGLLKNQSESNRLATDSMRRELSENDRIQGEAISGMTKSLSGFSDRLRSFESELANAKGQFDLLDQAATDRLTEHALSKARAIEARSLADRVSTEINRLNLQLQQWNEGVAVLQTNDSGRKLALSTDRLELLDDLLTHDRLTADDISALNLQLRELRVPIDAALSRPDTTILIPESSVLALEALLTEAGNTRQQLIADAGRLDSLLRQSTEPLPKGAPVLRDALAEHRKRRFDALNDKVRERLEAARATADDEISTAAEEAERSRQAAEVARTRLVAEAQREADEIRGRIEAQRIRDAADDDLRAETERQRSAKTLAAKQQRMNEYQKALPEIRRLLAPFISAGRRQLNGTQWQFSDQAGPLSYAGIRATGALQNAESGYEQFLWLAGGPNNDRANGAFPDYIGGNVEMNVTALVPAIRRSQVLIEEYGDLLVEQGLLAP